jgi:mannan endo-1,4-beta-mannosidase
MFFVNFKPNSWFLALMSWFPPVGGQALRLISSKSNMTKLIGVLLVFLSLSFSKYGQKPSFVKVNGKTFEIDKKPYYYIGTNYWYGAIIASTGECGNRQRLLKELDFMKNIGINNLRVLSGAEGPDNEPYRVTPTLQLSPGIYNDTLLDGLDFLLAEMQKRGQRAILYLNNAWDWSGGYAQYLNWNSYGPIPYPSVKHEWSGFIQYCKQFIPCEKCKEEYKAHVKFMLSRTNRYTHIKYTDDPTIMTWEIANEPRAFSQENIPAFTQWIKETAAYIKSLDKNHLVTTGTEGQHGCEESLELFEKIHSDPNIDYLTMHIWPKNWGWLNPEDIPGSIDKSTANTNEYMEHHMAIARKLNKPVVLEEYGLPRDKHGYSPDEPITCRNKFYDNSFAKLAESAAQKDALAGCNFWTFSGTARPKPGQIFWKKGDDYLGDPPVEEQGLNSVYDSDSTTIKLIRDYNEKLYLINKQ